MVLSLIKNVGISLALTAAVVIFVVFVLSQFLDIQVQLSSPSLVLAITGTTLVFSGNSFISDALGRHGAHGLPQYKWGGRIQSVGFALTIAALLIS